MASILHHHLHLFSTFPLFHPPNSPKLNTHSKFSTFQHTQKPHPVIRASTSESPTQKRRGRKKKPETTTTTTTEVQNDTLEPQNAEEEEEEKEGEELDDYDDDIDFPYEEPPLVCCFGAAQREFLPTVRVHGYPMHPDIYSEWKMLQWKPPEFARAPGGPPSNVAVAHARLGGRVAFLGKVGDDAFGKEMVLKMNKEKVQTRGVKFDSGFRTGCTYMKVKFDDGKLRMETVRESAEDSLRGSELNLAILKEVFFTHFIQLANLI